MSTKQSSEKMNEFKTWGFLRETEEKAKKAGVDKDTNLLRTGLDTYLGAIFPETDDWIHDKTTGIIENTKKVLYRPDYRSESRKLIVEFDGLPHYQNPDTIEKDNIKDKLYKSKGYKVVRIPYFIQLTKDSIYKLFKIKVQDEYFNENIPSLGIGRHTPAYLCIAGIKRMAQDFKNHPKQYEVNIENLRKINLPSLTGVEYLEEEYSKI